MEAVAMRVLAWICGIIGAIFSAYHGVGLLLPDQVAVERQIEIAQAPSAVFPLINDLHAFNKWWIFTSVGTVAPKNGSAPVEISGPPSGVGQKEIWLGQDGSTRNMAIIGEMEIVQSTADQHASLSFDTSSLKGTFAFDLAGTAGKTTVTWRADMALPTTFGRWTGYFLGDRIIGSLQRWSLYQLKELAETGAVYPSLPGAKHV